MTLRFYFRGFDDLDSLLTIISEKGGSRTSQSLAGILIKNYCTRELKSCITFKFKIHNLNLWNIVIVSELSISSSAARPSINKNSKTKYFTGKLTPCGSCSRGPSPIQAQPMSLQRSDSISNSQSPRYQIIDRLQ